MRLINKIFSKDKNEENDKVSKKKVGLGLVGIGVGAKQLKKSKSKITGLENFYHNTESKNVPNILDQGLKAKYSEDPSNLTNKVLNDIDMNNKKGKVYLAKEKSTAEGVGRSRRLNGISKSNKTLKINIPYEEFKKMKTVENPELRGAKTRGEFVKKNFERLNENPEYKEILNSKGNRFLVKAASFFGYKPLKEGTAVIEGDIDSKYIKGSKNYKKYGLKDMKNYIKNNPKRFAKGVGRAAIGTGLVAGGVHEIGKELNKKKKAK